MIAVAAEYFGGRYDWAFFVVRTGAIELSDNALLSSHKNDKNDKKEASANEATSESHTDATSEQNSPKKEAVARAAEKTPVNAGEQGLRPRAQEQGLPPVDEDRRMGDIKEENEMIAKLNSSTNNSHKNNTNNNTTRSVASPNPPVNVQFRGESSYFFAMEFSIFSAENIGSSGGQQNIGKNNINNSINSNMNKNSNINNNPNKNNNPNNNSVNNSININNHNSSSADVSRQNSRPNSVRGINGNDVLLDHINRSQSRHQSRR